MHDLSLFFCVFTATFSFICYPFHLKDSQTWNSNVGVKKGLCPNTKERAEKERFINALVSGTKIRPFWICLNHDLNELTSIMDILSSFRFAKSPTVSESL